VLTLAPETVNCTLSRIDTAATPSAPLLPEVRLFKVPEIKLTAAYAVADSPVGEPNRPAGAGIGQFGTAESRFRPAYTAYRQILPTEDVRTLRLAGQLVSCPNGS